MGFDISDDLLNAVISVQKQTLKEELDASGVPEMLARCSNSTADEAARRDAVRLLNQNCIDWNIIADALESSGHVVDGIQYIKDTINLDPKFDDSTVMNIGDFSTQKVGIFK